MANKGFKETRLSEHILSDNVSTHIRNHFGGWQAAFTVQQQTFYLQPVSSDKGDQDDTRERAEWYQGNLDHALIKLIKNEYENLLP